MSQGSVRAAVRAWSVAVVVGTVLAAASAAPAAAHNVLTGSTPARDAVEATVPGAVVLTFDQPVIGLGTRVVVTGPTGEIQAGQPRLVDNTVTQPLQPAAAAGAYTVAWRVTSVDGHPISGTFAFRADRAGSGQPPDWETVVDPPVAESSPSRGAVAVGVALLVALVALPLGIALRRRARLRRSPEILR